MTATITTTTGQSLTVPAELFGTDGLAALTVHGVRGGDNQWRTGVFTGPATDDTAHGVFTVAGTGDPDTALDTAVKWVAGECDRLGLKVVSHESWNHHHAVTHWPYFMIARVVVAGKDQK